MCYSCVECLAMEMTAENFAKDGAIHFIERRDGAEDFDFAIVFDGAAIFAIGFAGEDDAANIEMRGAECGDGEQRVIDGSQGCARDEKNGKAEMRHEIGHELGGIDGDESAAGAFDDEIFMWGDLREADFAEFDTHASALGGEMRRNGRREAVRFGKSARAREIRKAHHSSAISAFARAGLDRFPVDGVERGAEERGDGGFSDGGVSAGDEKAARHGRKRLKLWRKPERIR